MPGYNLLKVQWNVSVALADLEFLIFLPQPLETTGVCHQMPWVLFPAQKK